MSDWYQPKYVYLIKDRKGNIAPRTKVYPSKGGAKNGRNNFLDGIISNACSVIARYPNYAGVWIVYQTQLHNKSQGKITLKDCDLLSQRWSKPVTQKDVDKYYEIIETMTNEWQIEEIQQDYE